jgi:hypothetical protein
MTRRSWASRVLRAVRALSIARSCHERERCDLDVLSVEIAHTTSERLLIVMRHARALQRDERRIVWSI